MLQADSSSRVGGDRGGDYIDPSIQYYMKAKA